MRLHKENRKLWVDSTEDHPRVYYGTVSALYGMVKGESVQLMVICAGTSDRVILYREPGKPGTYVYTENNRIGYASIELYMPGEGKVWEMFLQGEEFEKDLGHLQPINRAKQLLQWLDF